MACNLRAGGALVRDALGAEGTTAVTGLHHIDRGCQTLEYDLQRLGAQIRRV